MELSVSILNAQDKYNMVEVLNNSDISMIHLDVMDGIFVPQTSLNIDEIKKISKLSKKKIDIHLMVSNPIEYIESIRELENVKYITIHLEIDKDVKEILKKIRSYGYKAGLSIKPNTHIDELLPYINDIDLVLLMTVEPGLGGQPFLERSNLKLKELRKTVLNNIKIEVDGGINNETIKLIKDADIAVIGSYITKSDNPLETINTLKV